MTVAKDTNHHSVN